MLVVRWTQSKGLNDNGLSRKAIAPASTLSRASVVFMKNRGEAPSATHRRYTPQSSRLAVH